MKEREQNDLLSLGSMMRQGYSGLIANAGKVVALITLALAVLITFTNVAFSDIRSEVFTSTLIIMLISAYIMYFSLEDTGEREGEECEEYRQAKDRYLKAKERITPDMIDSLREFCLDYSSRELDYRRLGFLSERGLSKSDLERYKKGEKFPLTAALAFKRAERLRAVKLSPAMLLSHSHLTARSEIVNPRGKKILGALISLVPSTFCMIFTLSVMLTAKENMSVSTIIESIMKLSALPIIGIKGLLDGYSFAKEDKSTWLNTKARLLESFLDN